MLKSGRYTIPAVFAFILRGLVFVLHIRCRKYVNQVARRRAYNIHPPRIGQGPRCLRSPGKVTPSRIKSIRLPIHLLTLQFVQINAIETPQVDRLMGSFPTNALIDDGNATRRAEGMTGGLGAETVAVQVFPALDLYFFRFGVYPQVGVLCGCCC